ncbi:hypothetical protein [Pengzhenrongella frigida]|uniref:Uncharacterized protein n=1 Tax=Pengzhenrongella frigida TaxID=1259133 RepID=A0A4Q5MVV6_9MICO|nr:hypothetical protein [Cellulomonas sp. HLT2-17]RYV49698.1 hypothetical protein EUA98_17415 [Cellulomonas sp. HLT2-17]
MSDAGRLAGFGIGLAAALSLGFGIGALVGPVDGGRVPAVVQEDGHTSPAGQDAMETEAGQ